VYYYNGTQRTTSSYRLVDCILGFDLAWFSSLFSKRLCIFGLRGAIYIFNKIFAYGTSFSLLFSELSLVGLALDLVD